MEKNIKKNVCMCITELSCCIAEINTTLKVNYTSIKKNKISEVKCFQRVTSSKVNCCDGVEVKSTIKIVKINNQHFTSVVKWSISCHISK